MPSAKAIASTCRAHSAGASHSLATSSRSRRRSITEPAYLRPQQHARSDLAGASNRIAAADREQFLQDLSTGKVKEGPLDLAAWFNGLAYPLFVQGAFADPIYGGNRDKAAWKMIGYPGLPAVYNQDVVRYRGKPHPRSANPQSIQDLS